MLAKVPLMTSRSRPEQGTCAHRSVRGRTCFSPQTQCSTAAMKGACSWCQWPWMLTQSSTSEIYNTAARGGEGGGGGGGRRGSMVPVHAACNTDRCTVLGDSCVTGQGSTGRLTLCQIFGPALLAAAPELHSRARRRREWRLWTGWGQH